MTKRLLFVLVSFGAAFAISSAAFAEVYASRVEAQLVSAVPGSSSSAYVTGNEVASQGALTTPLSATFSQRNESPSNFVDHTITSSASFASTTRGRLTHSYESTFANPTGGIDFQFARNQTISPFDTIPFGQIDFTANSEVLSVGFATAQSGGQLFDFSRAIRIDLFRESPSGNFNFVSAVGLPDIVPFQQQFGGGGFQVGLIQGENYRLSVEPNQSHAYGALSGDFYNYGFDLAWTTDGFSQDNPVLPDVSTGPAFEFERVPSGLWYDPVIATGYDFETTDGSLFTSILDLPTGFNEPFTVTVEGNVLGQFGPGDSVDFGMGVSAFTISGIDPGTDPDDSLAFPIQLAFDRSLASFTMTPVTIPEPAFGPFLFGFGAFACLRRRARKAVV